MKHWRLKEILDVAKDRLSDEVFASTVYSTTVALVLISLEEVCRAVGVHVAPLGHVVWLSGEVGRQSVGPASVRSRVPVWWRTSVNVFGIQPRVVTPSFDDASHTLTRLHSSSTKAALLIWWAFGLEDNDGQFYPTSLPPTDKSWISHCTRSHRRRSSVNFGVGKAFCPKIYAWKINKIPEFYMIFARKIFSRIFGPPCSPSPTPMHGPWTNERSPSAVVSKLLTFSIDKVNKFRWFHSSNGYTSTLAVPGSWVWCQGLDQGHLSEDILQCPYSLENSLSYIVAAENMGLSSLKFFWLAPKTHVFWNSVRNGASRSSKVIDFGTNR